MASISVKFATQVCGQRYRIASHMSLPRFCRFSSTISDDKRKTISKFKLLCLLQEYTMQC